MKKFLGILLIFVAFCVSGCDKEKSYIIFNKQPFTQENVLNGDYLFREGDRVYYLITFPKPVVTRKIFVQVYKRDNDFGQYGYQLMYGKHIKLKDENESYYTDYFVLHGKGVYEFKVYSGDEPTKELTSNIVQVR